MSGHKDREKAREHARQLYTLYDKPICPNCKEAGAHFAPPSVSEPGFFTCEKEEFK